MIDAWSQCTDKVADALMSGLSSTDETDSDTGTAQAPERHLHDGAFRRARRAGADQAAGLHARPDGQAFGRDHRDADHRQFKEGLSVGEYFNSTHGARKGLADTALKTANSGYLTRRLVMCPRIASSSRRIAAPRRASKSALWSRGRGDRLARRPRAGALCAHDVADPASGEVLVEADTMIEERHMAAIRNSSLEKIEVRSVLTCKSEIGMGVCARCYGRDLARGTTVNLGEAVGVIAAQSIGEPGTRSPWRTGHIGGAASAAGMSPRPSTARWRA